MGIGALFVRDGLALSPTLYGGGQQAGRRSGTVPTALTVGLGMACRLARQRRGTDAKRILALRERLYAGLAKAIPGVRRNSPAERCLPGCLNISIAGVDTADLLLDLPGIALSTGSACGHGGPSPILTAMGIPAEIAYGSLRFGLGRSTGDDEIDTAIAELAEAVSRWRAGNSIHSAA
jgi:cysteine desulfurase